MNLPDEGLGAGWIALGFLGFVIGYALAKIKLLSDNNAVQFCMWGSGAVAAALAFADGSLGMSTIEFLGRIATFAIFWLYFGVVLTIGTLIGIEKAGKK